MNDTKYIVIINISGDDGGWMFEPSAINVDKKRAKEIVRGHKKHDTDAIMFSADDIIGNIGES